MERERENEKDKQRKNAITRDATYIAYGTEVICKACMYVRTYVRMYVCMYVYTNMYEYTHLYGYHRLPCLVSLSLAVSCLVVSDVS